MNLKNAALVVAGPVRFLRLLAGALTIICATPVVAEDADSLCQWLATEGPSYLAATGGPGMAVGIIDHGKLRCGQGFGVVRRGSDQPVTINTNFHMASVSKTFVSTAIVKLISDGRVRLDDPVTRHIPTFRLADSRFRQITLRHLLNHTSGLPDVEDYQWDKPERDNQALARYVASFKTMKLRAKPGARFYYSNNNSEVLGAVIARVSGMSFEDFVNTRLLQPSGMERSSFIYTQGVPTDQATGHILDSSGKPVVSDIHPFSRRHGPSSTLQSNVADMGRWLAQMMRQPPEGKAALLSENERDLLFRPFNRDIAKDEPDRIPPNVRVALSWFVLPYQKRTLINHPGADVGFASLIVFDPENKTGVVIMTNADQPDPTSVTTADGLPNIFGFDLAARILNRFSAPLQK